MYSVWVPILWSDGKVAIPQATKRLPDQRVRHYWDGKGELVKEYSQTLQINGPAWDIYLVFDRSAEWKDRVPAPVYWMDQLGLENGRPFDANTLKQQIEQMIAPPPAGFPPGDK